MSTLSVPPSLVGRDHHHRRLEALVDRARRGQGGALRIDGRPGVGKTALLTSIATCDLPVLRTTGSESEAGLPFAALEELLSGLADGVEALQTEVDAAALLRAIADRLAAAAPLVLLVDDAQWLDPSSRDAVIFLARRAHRLGIALVAVWSARGPVPAPWPDVPVLTLEDLDTDAAIRVAETHGLAPAVAVSVVTAIGGNPLALTELPRHLSAAQRAGRAPLPHPLPVGHRLQDAVAERCAALPAAARSALLRAAAGAPMALVAGDLGPAEDAGLVRLGVTGAVGNEIRFEHPLVRAAVFHGASATDRRAAHRWIAERVVEPERSWQMALATPVADEQLAARLEAFGDDTERRGAPAAAAEIHARAASLSPSPDSAVPRAIKAAMAAAAGGQPLRARGALEAVLPTIDDPGLRADVQLLRGMVLHQAGAPREARRLLEHEAQQIAGRDPARAAALLVQACIAMMGSGPMDDLAATARRAVRLAPPELAVVPAVIAAETYVNIGAHDDARALLAAHAETLRGWDPTGPGYEVPSIAGLCHLWLGDHDVAKEILDRIIEANRATGAVIPLALPLAILACVHLRRGDLVQAAACTEEATEIAETGLGLGASTALVRGARAMVAAHRGDVELCRTTAERLLAEMRTAELPATAAACEQALGHLALSQGDAATAVVHLERARMHAAVHGTRDPGFLFTPGDAVEALTHVGRRADAERVQADLEREAARTGGIWARSVTHRGRAILGPAEAIDGELEAALDAHRRLPMPFEEARTRLAIGERLRRERRPADARVLLSDAAEAFRAMGARLWVARADRELAAAGGSATSTDVDPADDPLTAREHDVCELVAAGRTNREVAATLFLSPRTVEHHLRSAYRKLDVRSRTELAARYAVRPAGTGSPAER